MVATWTGWTGILVPRRRMEGKALAATIIRTMSKTRRSALPTDQTGGTRSSRETSIKGGTRSTSSSQLGIAKAARTVTIRISEPEWDTLDYLDCSKY
jgi:hypothetical protein